MDRPPRSKHPAATSAKLPTIKSAPSIARSITSYSTPCEKDPTISGFGNATEDEILDHQHQVKATLTNILNDDRVKHNPDGTRCVQKILLENEKDMREQRRHSLSTCTAKRTMHI
ncbi:hypothetical protein N7475_004045 [Penicillium sp. IBT 31633x]|nr:hypothetical protein N7475_004045 [Penicillium sp. IBT 31633x]